MALIGTQSPNRSDDLGVTPLMLAARLKHRGPLLEILRQGADITRVDQFGWSALMDTLAAGWEEGALDLLDATPADATDPGRCLITGLTAVSLAVHCGLGSVVERLLQRTPTELLEADSTLRAIAAVSADLKITTAVFARVAPRANEAVLFLRERLREAGADLVCVGVGEWVRTPWDECIYRPDFFESTGAIRIDALPESLRRRFVPRADGSLSVDPSLDFDPQEDSGELFVVRLSAAPRSSPVTVCAPTHLTPPPSLELVLNATAWTRGVRDGDRSAGWFRTSSYAAINPLLLALLHLSSFHDGLTASEWDEVFRALSDSRWVDGFARMLDLAEVRPPSAAAASSALALCLRARRHAWIERVLALGADWRLLAPAPDMVAPPCEMLWFEAIGDETSTRLAIERLGLPVNGSPDANCAPLHHACAREQAPLASVERILAAGADPNIPARTSVWVGIEAGDHPIHVATKNLRGEVVQTLLAAGARHDVRTAGGMSLVRLAASQIATSAPRVARLCHLLRVLGDAGVPEVFSVSLPRAGFALAPGWSMSVNLRPTFERRWESAPVRSARRCGVCGGDDTVGCFSSDTLEPGCRIVEFVDQCRSCGCYTTFGLQTGPYDTVDPPMG